MRLIRSQLRSAPVRRTTLIAGISAAAAAFTVLCMNATAITVQVSGRLPGASPLRSYDILVRVPSRVSSQAGPGSLARPTDLAELSGGITLTQYNTIRRLPGVQVAAPMTMVGYVPVTVVIPVAIPAGSLTSTPALFTVTARQRTDAGLSSSTAQNVGSTYVSTSPLAASRVCQPASPAPLPQVFSADAQRRTAC